MSCRKYWFASLVLIVATTRVLNGAIVFSNDFETNTNGFNTSSRISLPTDAGGFSSINQSQYLGQFLSNAVTLSLTGLNAGTVYSVKFDLLTAYSWDGNGTTHGPDNWRLAIDGINVIDTTFGGGPNGQSYSDTHVLGFGNFAERAGADVVFFAPNFVDYAIYYFGHGAGNPVITFTATSPSALLTFTGILGGTPDETWSLDNVVISEAITGSAVPEPTSLALWSLGALGMALLHRRRTAI